MVERRFVFQAVGLSLVLVSYGIVVNLLPQGFHDKWYILLNLSFLGLLLVWAIWGFRLTRGDLGLAFPQSIRSSAWGLGIGLALTGPLFILAAFPQFFAGKLEDPRIAEFTWAQVIYRALVRIPFGTALFEEMTFRGVLFGALSRFGVRKAVVYSSMVFGLWHVVPTLDLLEATDLGDSRALLVTGIVGGVVATSIGGIMFALLRHATRSVAGPILLHASINSLALVAFYLRQG